MNPQTPSISEALAFFAGLSAEVSTHVISLLIWLQRSIESDGYTRISNADLALAMHVNDSTVRRSFSEARDRGFIINVDYGFQVGDRPIRYSTDPPGISRAKGRHVGRRCKLNWQRIKKLSDPGRVILTTQTETESTISAIGSPPRQRSGWAARQSRSAGVIVGFTWCVHGSK